MKFGFSVEWAWGSALRAGVLSSCFAKKKVAKEEGDPRVGALRVPCATRNAGRLAKLACGSNNASRLPPALLRCSAPPMGTRKASWTDGSAKEEQTSTLSSQLRESPIVGFHRFGRDALPGPLRGAEQRRNAGGRRRGLSEGRSPEFRSRPAFRVAQGTPAGGTDPGSPFLCVLSFGEAKESTTPRKGGTLTPNKLTTQRSRERSEGSEATPSRCNALRLLPPTGLNNPSPDRKNCQSSATA